MTVELKSRLWVDHRSEKWTNNRPIKIEAIPLTTVSTLCNQLLKQVYKAV